MILDLELDTAPAAPLLTLAEAKSRLKIDGNDEDDDIQGMVDTAIGWLDGQSGQLGRALVSQSWKLHGSTFWELIDHSHRYRFGVRYGAPYRFGLLRAWPNAIHLPLPPLIDVSAIEYFDVDGQAQTVDLASVWIRPGERGEVRPITGFCWPATQCERPRAVTITFTAGYGDAASNVPAPIRTAALLLVGHMYRNREAVVGVEQRDSSTELPLGVARYLTPFRLQKV